MPKTMEEMLSMLARQPLAERKFRLREMLDVLHSMPEEGARMQMRMVMEQMRRLPEEQVRAITEARLHVLAEYAERKRIWLMERHREVLMALPAEMQERDQKITQAAMQQLAEPQRRPVMQAMQTVMGEAERRRAA